MIVPVYRVRFQICKYMCVKDPVNTDIRVNVLTIRNNRLKLNPWRLALRTRMLSKSVEHARCVKYQRCNVSAGQSALGSRQATDWWREWHSPKAESLRRPASSFCFDGHHLQQAILYVPRRADSSSRSPPDSHTLCSLRMMVLMSKQGDLVGDEFKAPLTVNRQRSRKEMSSFLVSCSAHILLSHHNESPLKGQRPSLFQE